MLMRLRNSRYVQYLAAITATLSMAAGAMHLAWTSPSLTKLQSDHSPIGRPISDEEGSWIVSISELGTIPASILGGYSIDKFGTKKTLLFAGVLTLLSWLLIIGAKTLGVLLFGRLLGGTALTLIASCCIIYNGEIAENDIRGRLGASLIILKLLGQLSVLTAGPYISYTSLGMICASLPVVFLCIFVFMPESPYYLVKIGDKTNAKKTLRSLSSKDVDDKFLRERFSEIQRCVEHDMKNKTCLWEFLSKEDYRRSILIMIGIKTLHQLSGIVAIVAYMQTIIELTSSSISPEASSIIFGIVQIFGALASSYLVDKIGRKLLLIISASGSAIALFGEGAYFFLQDVINADLSSMAWLPTTCLALYLVMCPLGIVTLPYILLSELFPTNIKGVAVSSAALYGMCWSFLTSKFFKPLSNVCGIYTVFWMFGSICICGAIFVQLYLPETKGKTFSEIQTILRRPKEKDAKTEEVLHLLHVMK